MPAPPRILLPGYLTLLTTRAEEGLPFVATNYMKLIVQSAIARAQHLYPVTVCAFCLMSNHLHLLLVVQNAEAVVLFMDRLKTELAHAINRLRGRRKRTVWCDGYDAVPILTVENAVEKFVYLYTNPQSAGLEQTIEAYPGFSTWNMFVNEIDSIQTPWIRRPTIPVLPQPSVSEAEDNILTQQLRGQSEESFALSIDPFAWLACFNLSPNKKKLYKRAIIDGVRAKERSLAVNLQGRCIGAEALRRQPIDKPYSPKKFSRRMWCICHDIALRTTFIAGIKELLRRAKDVYQRWKNGDFSVPYPSELFAPRFPKLLHSRCT